ncbi:MAG: hypothetical protein QMC67_05720 [Candidatus Wallbacteria bacterium]
MNLELELKKCCICGDFKDKEIAYQKYGWEENDSFLPQASEKLIAVKDLKPNSTRVKILKQCPECKTYYLYTTDYEYFVNGSENEQCLIRLTDKDTLQYLSII